MFKKVAERRKEEEELIGITRIKSSNFRAI